MNWAAGFVGVVLLVWASTACVEPARATCLHYNAPISLRGLLIEKTFQEDPPTLISMLRLPAPVCVSGTPKWENPYRPNTVTIDVEAIQQFQLMLGPNGAGEDEEETAESLRGKTVTVVGTLVPGRNATFTAGANVLDAPSMYDHTQVKIYVRQLLD
jgi:hypothetical protein